MIYEYKHTVIFDSNLFEDVRLLQTGLSSLLLPYVTTCATRDVAIVQLPLVNL